jgi:mannose PTS system EIIA component
MFSGARLCLDCVALPHTFFSCGKAAIIKRNTRHWMAPSEHHYTMNTGILIIAHAPLASALRSCVLHVYPENATSLLALDVVPNETTETTRTNALALLAQLSAPQTLVLTDVFGATPCNVAQKVVDGSRSKLVAGINLPMLLRTVNYRHEPLDALVARALAGGTQCIMQVAITAPQNQVRKNNDYSHHDHQQ